MKLLLTALMLSIITGTAFSQSLLNRVQSAAASQGITTPSAASLPSISNITSAKDAIMSKLTPALALTTAQKPAVSTDVTDFLKQKATILPLLSTNKTAYASKLSTIQGSLSDKLKTTLTPAQYTKFVALKPQAPSTTNVLSSLFF